ncbi:hypothetical protein I7I51_08125 [Histoplasma capsulatum]|uniref:Uncharacterized protein n=1 Tax=Ajellomyces capsulatus TaxID=5037 RepID=A0A8A1LX17_AJECA|nr:hypothetical protein I7I51_08125 [Histoplasma capsulatum]
MREIEDQASLSSGSHRRLSAVNSQLRLGMEGDRVGRAAMEARPTQRCQQIPQIPGRYQIRLRRTQGQDGAVFQRGRSEEERAGESGRGRERDKKEEAVTARAE